LIYSAERLPCIERRWNGTLIPCLTPNLSLQVVGNVPVIKQLELNPIFALPTGQDCRIVQGQIRVQPSREGTQVELKRRSPDHVKSESYLRPDPKKEAVFGRRLSRVIEAQGVRLPNRSVVRRNLRMEVSAWSNGRGTYSIQVGIPNRDKHFDPAWTVIEVEIDGHARRFPLTPPFWN